MKVADRLVDPAFTREHELRHYSRADIEALYDDQMMFVAKHVNAFNSGHETAFEAGAALGKYVERAMLALKVNGDFDPAAARGLPVYDPRRRLLEVSQELVRNKGDPAKVKDVLAGFSTAWPRTPENGVLEFMRTMEKVLPGMKHQTGAAALQRRRNGEETARTLDLYRRCRLHVHRLRREQAALLARQEGSAAVTAFLADEKQRIDVEMQAVRARIAEIERLAPDYLSTDWNHVVRLQEQLDGVRLLLDALPHRGTAIHRRYSADAAAIEAKLRAARERGAASGGDIATELYERVPEYARLTDRLLLLTESLAQAERARAEAEKRAEIERRLALLDLSGPWIGGAGEARPARAKVTHEGDRVRMDIEWEGIPGDAPQLRAEGRLRFGIIEGFWRDLTDPEAKVHGLFEAELSDDGSRIRVNARTHGHPRRKDLDWNDVVFTRGTDPGAAPRERVPGPERYVTSETYPRTGRIRNRIERLRTYAFDELEGRVYVLRDCYDGKTETFHENGARASEEHYVDGKRDGAYRSWHADGEPHFTAVYRDGKLSGDYEERTPGRKKTGRYENGLENGVFEVRNPNDEILSHTYRAGILHGPFSVRRPLVRETGTYVDGKLHGEKIAENLTAEGAVQGRIVEVHEAGRRVLSTETHGDTVVVTSYDGEVAHGPFVHKRGGRVIQQGEYRRGAKHGEWTTNGYVFDAVTKSEILDSTVIETFDNGELKSIRTTRHR
jgi:antitoxin component YwqK of YwqJK toxin-antitoxin module